MSRLVIRTFALLLVIVLGVSVTRDLVCQVACAEPDAAHAAAACHDAGDVGGTLLQSLLDHCTVFDASPALTAIKVNGPRHQRAAIFALRSTAPLLTLAPPARVELLPVFGSSRAHRPAVLRI
jgi:hypothetical protein